ncbi:MAG: hypothetical protein CMI09_00495 [Oceanospirillaceae bacterium]|nr:hypothetical protein [Oceanospirillaceae bacterium]|tara:strand:- start:458 stop:682 length:225 start_codon:yes stop_codon:yes gene_type:complete
MKSITQFASLILIGNTLIILALVVFGFWMIHTPDAMPSWFAIAASISGSLGFGYQLGRIVGRKENELANFKGLR